MDKLNNGMTKKHNPVEKHMAEQRFKRNCTSFESVLKHHLFTLESLVRTLENFKTQINLNYIFQFL